MSSHNLNNPNLANPELITIPLTESLVRGAAELEQTEEGLLPHRLPAWARAQCTDPQLAMVEAQSAGVRLVFRTTATVIELDTRRTRTTYAGIQRPDGVIELSIDGEVVAHWTTFDGTTTVIDLATGTPDRQVGRPSTTRFADLPQGVKDVVIWLPHNESTEILALRLDAEAQPGPARQRPVWVHHGSSISQGSNAVRPTGTWPVVAARLVDLDLVNLGFGGGALLDPFVARVIRDAPAELISLELGINLVNADLMRLRALGPAVHGFLDMIRDGHPTTPLLVVSAIHCPIHEDTPGPGAIDAGAFAEGTLRFSASGDPADIAGGKLTLRVIREELARIVSERRVDDPHLHHVDGRELYGPADAEQHPLPDNLHPGPETHQSMGERFAAVLGRLV